MKKRNIINLLLFTFIISFFQGCTTQNSIQSAMQTTSAAQVGMYKDQIIEDLLKYKKKLDLRNPYSYNKSLSDDLTKQIKTNKDYINIIQDEIKLKTANEYLYYAFTKANIENRNDFLIIGLYKLIYKAYNLQEPHQFAAIQYNKKYMQELYTYLQVIRWKIRTKKDFNDNYLFTTWQNNWQIEFMKKDIDNLNEIRNLEYIKANKETILDHSNFSFENLMTKMLLNVRYTLKKINVEPYDMSISALKSFIFII